MKEVSLKWVIVIAVLICIIVVVGGIFLSYGVASKLVGVNDDVMNTRGLFGDSWGGVNALVSALAFAGVIVTLFLQNRDLNLQRDEMKLQRNEFEKENATIKYQRFENLFYNMLNLQQTIVDGLRYDYYDDDFVTVPLDGGGTTIDKRQVKREVVGRDVFRYLFNEVPLLVKIDEENHTICGYRRYLAIRGFSDYDKTLVPSYFDHYFRHLYKIVKYVDSENLPFEESYKYLSFLRGTLSRYELVWLYYNAMYPDFIEFKKLIEKYSLLKALRSDLLTITKEAKVYYERLGISNEYLEKSNFGTNDFFFYLTDNSDDDSKYSLSAFWKAGDRHVGADKLARWRAFVNGKAESIVHRV